LFARRYRFYGYIQKLGSNERFEQAPCPLDGLTGAVVGFRKSAELLKSVLASDFPFVPEKYSSFV
jgi:hypothetical protein